MSLFLLLLFREDSLEAAEGLLLHLRYRFSLGWSFIGGSFLHDCRGRCFVAAAGTAELAVGRGGVSPVVLLENRLEC